MNRDVKPGKYAALMTILLLVGIVGSVLLWLRAQRSQHSLDRQLIAALVKKDTIRALSLVNSGANPDSRYLPTAVPSLETLARQLLRHSPRTTNNSPTALMMACGASWSPAGASFVFGDSLLGPDDSEADRISLVQAMLAHGATVELRGELGFTPLMCGVSSHCLEIVRLLLARGAVVNSRDDLGETALCHAIVYSVDADTVQYLLMHGADPNIATKDGQSTLSLARRYGGPEIVDLIQQTVAKSAPLHQ